MNKVLLIFPIALEFTVSPCYYQSDNRLIAMVPKEIVIIDKLKDERYLRYAAMINEENIESFLDFDGNSIEERIEYLSKVLITTMLFSDQFIKIITQNYNNSLLIERRIVGKNNNIYSEIWTGGDWAERNYFK